MPLSPDFGIPVLGELDCLIWPRSLSVKNLNWCFLSIEWATPVGDKLVLLFYPSSFRVTISTVELNFWQNRTADCLFTPPNNHNHLSARGFQWTWLIGSFFLPKNVWHHWKSYNTDNVQFYFFPFFSDFPKISNIFEEDWIYVGDLNNLSCHSTRKIREVDKTHVQEKKWVGGGAERCYSN